MITPINAHQGGFVTPENDEARTTVAVGSGSKTNENQHRQSTQDRQEIQDLANTMSHFQRLEKGFAAKGWCLYPLSGDTLLATIPKWGMSRTLPDLRAAQILLRQIGGGA